MMLHFKQIGQYKLWRFLTNVFYACRNVLPIIKTKYLKLFFQVTVQVLFIDQNTGFGLLSFRENINRKTVAKIFFQTKRSTFYIKVYHYRKLNILKFKKYLRKPCLLC